MVRTKSSARLERILDAAALTFLELGYRRTKLTTVARRAGVSSGSLYLYTRGKQALFELVLRRAFGETMPHAADLPFEGSAGNDLVSWLWLRFNQIAQFPLLTAAAAAPAPDAPGREMEAVLREIWAWQSRYWQALELVERCARDWPELAMLFYTQFRRGVFGVATTLIQRRMEEGAFRRYPDAATVVRVIAENVAFFAMHRHLRPDSANLDEETCRETVIAILLAGLSPAGGPFPSGAPELP
jgi:AcrR family transcriptional regulator